MLERLVAGLDRRRFEPIVCSLCPPGRVGRRIAESGVPVGSLGLSPRARLVEMARAALRLARGIDELGIDLVHSMLYRANVLAALAGRLSRRRPPVVSGQHSLTPMAGRPAALAARLTRPFVHRIVAVSEAVAREVARAEGADPARIVVIANGVDVERFRPGGPDGGDRESGREAARERLGLAPDAIVVGAIGRHSPEKGLLHLLEAVARARARGCPLELLLAGDGPQRVELERRARGLGLGGWVTFLGVRRDPEWIYPALDVFALPSLEEGSPIALLEAMACGCAVVASRVGGVPEVVEAGDGPGYRTERSVAGLTVAPRDPEALARALALLAGDPGLRRRLGLAARRRIEAELGVATMVERHERLYEEMIEPAPT